MPDKDYTQFLTADTASTKDYTKLLSPKIGESNHIKLPPASPNVEKLMNDTQRYLTERGYSADTIDALMVPVGELRNPMVLDTIYRDIKPALETNIKGVEEALKMEQVARGNGVNMEFKEVAALSSMLQRFTTESLEGLSEGHKWWMNMKRQAGNKAADFISGSALNLTLGLSLLDAVDHFDKAGLSIAGQKIIPGKIDVLKAPIPGTKVIPIDEIHDIENRTMPTITLEGPDGPRDFNTGTSAALWLIGQKVWGFGERNFADVPPRGLASMSKLIGNEPLEEFFGNIAERTEERGEARGNIAAGQIPPLVSALGEPSTVMGSGLSWIDIAERKLGLEQVFDKAYMWMEDHGTLGDLAMSNVAFTNGLYDVMVVPSLAIAGVIGKIPKAATTLTKVLGGIKGTEKVSNLATEVAHSTRRLDDIVNAVDEAEIHFKAIDRRLTNSIKENVRATGKPKAPADLYRRWILARRQLNNNKQMLDNMKDPALDEVLLQSPRRNPLLLPEPASTADEATKEIHKHRKQWLVDGPSKSPDFGKMDLPRFQQRKVLGPDDAEQAAYGLEAMIKTGGAGMDDIAVTPLMPEYHVTPASGPIDFIDWTNVPKVKARAEAEQRFIKSISGEGLPETPGQLKFDPTQQSLRMLIQEEDIIRRNLGTARAIKDRAKIDIHTKNLAQIRKVMNDVRTKGVQDNYDDIWLPADQPTIMDNAERFGRWLNIAGDRVLRSLTPGALRTGYWHSTLGTMHTMAREPQRFFEVADPAAWDRIRSGFLRHQQSVGAWNDKTSELLLKSGALKMREGKFNIKKHFHPYDIDRKTNEQLFDLLNTVKGSDEFAELASVAPASMLKAHDEIRKVLDTAADLQGLSNSDRYLEGYVHHVFDKNVFDQGARPMEFVGLSPNSEAFVSHLMKRRGNAGYPRDAVAALEIYGRAMHRKMILEPLHQDILRIGDELTAKNGGNTAYSMYTTAFVRQLQGKPAILGEIMDNTIGATINAKGGIKLPGLSSRVRWNPQAVDRKLMGLASLMHMSMLGGNPRYPFMQIITAIPTTASRFGLLRTFKGISNMATREGQAMAKTAGVYQPFIDVLEAPAMRQLSKFIFEKMPAISPFGVMTNARAEMMIRGVTYHAAIDAHLTKMGFATWDEAVKAGMSRRISFDALRSSEEVNHMYGAKGRQPLVSAAAGQGFSISATQFLSFIWKQSDELLSQATRSPGMLAKYLAISGWASKVAARDMGIDATQYVGLGYLPQDIGDVSSPGVDFATTLVEVGAAHLSHDPQRISQAHSRLLESATNVIPMKIAATSAMKAANRIMEGEIMKTSGQKLRDLDFAKDGTFIEKLFAGDIDQLLERGDVAPGIGPESTPTMFAQRNLKEELFRRGAKALRQETSRFYFNRRRAIRDYVEAAEGGNDEAEQKLMEDLRDIYRIRLSGSTPIERAIEARHINDVTRYIHPDFGGDALLLDRYEETLKRFGINMRGEQ